LPFCNTLQLTTSNTYSICFFLHNSKLQPQKVTGITKTANNHPSILESVGDASDRFQVSTMDNCRDTKFDNVVFCAPPSGFDDYAGAVRDAVTNSWSGLDNGGTFVFTSSGGMYVLYRCFCFIIYFAMAHLSMTHISVPPSITKSQSQTPKTWSRRIDGTRTHQRRNSYGRSRTKSSHCQTGPCRRSSYPKWRMCPSIGRFVYLGTRSPWVLVKGPRKSKRCGRSRGWTHQSTSLR